MNIYGSRIAALNLDQYKNLLQRLTTQQRAKIIRLKRQGDACRALHSIVLLRTVFKMHFNIEMCEDMMEYNAYGKPFISSYPSFHFNLSHSGHWVVCAVDSRPIGIDIEQIQAIDFSSIVRNYFCADEYKELMSRPDSEQLDYFYYLWTIKESHVKALGKGLAIPFNSFAITGSGNNLRIQYPHQSNNFSDGVWFCKPYILEPGYKMAVCAMHNTFPREPVIVDIDL